MDPGSGAGAFDAEQAVDIWSLESRPTGEDTPPLADQTALWQAFSTVRTVISLLRDTVLDPRAVEIPARARQTWPEYLWRLTVASRKGEEEPDLGPRDLAPFFAPSDRDPINLYPTYQRIDAASVLTERGAVPAVAGILRVVVEEDAIQEAIRDVVRTRRLNRGREVPDDPPTLARLCQDRAAILFRSVRTDDGLQVAPGLKLGGTRIMNFSGFLSAQWRTTDWFWGRIDGAVGLAEMLGGTRADTDALKRSVNADAQAPEDGGLGGPLTGGVGGLSRLRPHYRLALGSAMGRLAGRALTGTSGVARVLGDVVIGVLSPLLVLLPLLLTPVRAGVVALALFAGLGAVNATGAGLDRPDFMVPLVVGVVLMLPILVQAMRKAGALRVWDIVEIAHGLAERPDPRGFLAGAADDFVPERRKRTMRRGRNLLRISSVATVATVAAAAAGAWLTAVPLAVTALVAALRVGQARLGVVGTYGPAPARARLGVWLMAMIALLVHGVAILAPTVLVGRGDQRA